ncbi:Protein kinase domain [Arabidopsis thaliana x Arabidopsis arenosa]|uniref:non-specific serine/threonine protein kinase n=1 Tax=Arabidopsis thaliana x Arabidopsis arenosa TaxID=1240361 RepID=A0A8T2AWV8_9BRAS|nr:Protein kinase domain [Arabidopsis thaliana x Arabidopsis arenosa]
MRLFLLVSFFASMLLEAYGFTAETDRQSLLEFKSQVPEGKQVVLSSWNNSFPLCNWKGVKCGSKHKRVISLDLNGFQLGGVISPSIGNLSFLISLDLSNNTFGGTIPEEIGNLFRLKYLNMASNVLGGRIPVSLSNCSRLLELILIRNHLGGGVPSELGSLTNLGILYLGRNNLKGKLPASIGNLTSLRYLGFGVNYIEGEVPDSMSKLTQLLRLHLGSNRFSGVFPSCIYNLSSLEYLYLFDNGFSGSLRSDFGNMLPNLQDLNMGRNHYTGAIPTTLSNVSTLQRLVMEENNLTGSIPLGFGKIPRLQILSLNQNSLGSQSFGDLEFLGSLTNCTQLETLYVGENRLAGDLPTSIANLSRSLINIYLPMNHISGNIPHDIGNLVSLRSLDLGDNLLTGPLPTSIGKLSELGELSLYSNRMSRKIPSSIGNITGLVHLYLFNNSFEGTIPPSLGNCSYLLELWIANNKLSGIIPREIMQIPNLVTLIIEGNSLIDSLPNDVGRLQYLVLLKVGNNNLSGVLPQTLGGCLSLEVIYLQGNSFVGVIPDIKALMGVKRVDLSNNNLSGSIPRYFGNFPSLEYLNLSVNKFEGRVPTEGKFQNVTIVSVFGNKDLCGGIQELNIKPCPLKEPTMVTKHSSHLKKVAIGVGSFGTVFKALLPIENKVVAVKVLNLQRRGAMKSFMAECESLKDIRHRNLVKLLSACSSIDFQGNEFRALIYEFMTNGSLDMWLHPEEVEEIRRPSRTLTLLERLSISIDVGSVLDYLHVYCHEPIAHCDLKPSNVLLDDDLTAHVSDFGLARLLLKFDKDSFLNQLSSAGVRGTIGYAAPEYGIGGQPSIHGDVYSFGVLILEMFTGKRPTNVLFEGTFTLHNYVKLALPKRVLDIADESILHCGLRVGFPVAECLTLVLELGLRCCEESPTNRLATSEAAKEFISIREKFFNTKRTARR